MGLQDTAILQTYTSSSNTYTKNKRAEFFFIPFTLFLLVYASQLDIVYTL